MGLIFKWSWLGWLGIPPWQNTHMWMEETCGGRLVGVDSSNLASMATRNWINAITQDRERKVHQCHSPSLFPVMTQVEPLGTNLSELTWVILPVNDVTLGIGINSSKSCKVPWNRQWYPHERLLKALWNAHWNPTSIIIPTPHEVLHEIPAAQHRKLVQQPWKTPWVLKPMAETMV